jgi:cardiolipin synthase A/B
MPTGALLRRESRATVRSLANQAFSRAGGAPLIEGNHVRPLLDARENYPAWLEAIDGARHHVYFENYILCGDEAGELFAEALIRKAREGVRVRLIHDWLGCLGKASRGFWSRLRAGGIEVRTYNPPRLDSPFGWLSRDHRKLVAVDRRVAYVTGLCVGRMWLGAPEKNLAPWRDTGVEVRGPAVAEVERTFAQMWALLGPPLDDDDDPSLKEPVAPAGTMRMRIVASEPATAGLFRVDQLVAALASERLWLTDAYYAGTTAYVQALGAAAHDGVDVRLLVPNATDIPILKPLSRAGYRPLLEAGVRVFEWNGTMLHAKTAVADGHWARVGSSNLNIASWLGNCELDAVVEDGSFGRRMEEIYLEDLTHATEIVLTGRRPALAAGRSVAQLRAAGTGTGSAGRAAAGAVRIGNVIGAAFTDRRALGPVEAQLMVTGALLLLGFGILFALYPQALAYPIVGASVWISSTLLLRAYKLHRQGRQLDAKVHLDAAPRTPDR